MDHYKPGRKAHKEALKQAAYDTSKIAEKINTMDEREDGNLKLRTPRAEDHAGWVGGLIENIMSTDYNWCRANITRDLISIYQQATWANLRAMYAAIELGEAERAYRNANNDPHSCTSEKVRTAFFTAGANHKTAVECANRAKACVDLATQYIELNKRNT